MKFAVQMYSVRDVIGSGEDLLRALATVKEIGLEGVEFTGFYGRGAEIIRRKL